VNYLAIYSEVINLRFNNQTGKTAQVKSWVGQAEIALWNAADWNFKRVPLAQLSVVAGVATEPADFGKAKRLFDPRGSRLEYLEPDVFEEAFMAEPTPQVANATHYTVINRQIIVAPQETSIAFKLSYRRRYAHLNSGGATVAGLMSSDTDTPIWDSEFHYLLVPWAIILGEKLEKDPTAESLRAQRDEMLAGMISELTGGQEGEPIQYGYP